MPEALINMLTSQGGLRLPGGASGRMRGGLWKAKVWEVLGGVEGSIT